MKMYKKALFVGSFLVVMELWRAHLDAIQAVKEAEAQADLGVYSGEESR